MMFEKKYSKHILPAPIMMVPAEDGANPEGYKYLSVLAHKGELKTNHTLGFHYMTETYEDVYPHTHEDSEMLCFVGGNPENINDFDAEIEIVLGEEKEVYTITSPTVVSIPGGLIHGPLRFKRVTKPVFFIEVTLVGKGCYDINPEGQHEMQH
jgi:hypothetical protein